ncbi:MAG: HAD-IA family hydrolase [Sphingomonadales bacterium]|nr:HAD-IA family hydrolase [Sphingomonadales bacterium]
MTLDKYKALSFDCYGTLVDWETGILDGLQGWRERTQCAASDADILDAFGRIEPVVEDEHPGIQYPQVLEGVLARMGEELGCKPNMDECTRFGRSVGDWPVFPDTVEALKDLKRHYRLFILSNIDRASFSKTAKKLEVGFEAVFTAEEIGAWKPNPKNFDYLIDHLSDDFNIDSGCLVHVAQSLFHDHVPAKAKNLKTCWIKRPSKYGGKAARDPGGDVKPDYVFDTLADFAKAVLEANDENLAISL